MPIALYALAIGAFGIGVTEFVIMGLLVEVADSLSIGVPRRAPLSRATPSASCSGPRS